MSPEGVSASEEIPGFWLRFGLLLFTHITKEAAQEGAVVLDAMWFFSKAAHDEEQAEKRREIERKKTCECDACVAEREEERKQREAEEERRRQDEDDGYAADGYSDYD